MLPAGTDWPTVGLDSREFYLVTKTLFLLFAVGSKSYRWHRLAREETVHRR